MRPLGGVISTQTANKLGAFLHIVGAEGAKIVDFTTPNTKLRKLLTFFRGKIVS